MKPLHLLAAMLLAGTSLPPTALAEVRQPIVDLKGGLVYGEEGSDTAGSIGVTLPFLLDNGSYLFLEGRGGVAEDSVRFGSFGLGLRTPLDNGLIVGGYGYYDLLRTARGNTFSQLSIGAEAIGRIFEARVNAYLPLTDPKLADEFNRAFVSGDRLLFQSGSEQARRGADVEVGARLPVFPEDMQAQLKLFGGAYWYGGENMEDTTGGRVRAELVVAGLPGVRSDATLGFGASVSYDDEDRLQGGFGVRLRVPLGSGNAAPKSAFDPLIQPVERTEVIRTHLGSTGDVEAAEYASDGEQVGKVVAITPTSGDAASINVTLAAAGHGALALANGSIALNETLLLSDHQHLLGGGGIIAVRGATSGQQAVFRNDGAAALLTGTNPLANVVWMGSGSEIAAVSIHGGLAGIHSADTSDLMIRDVHIAEAAGDGIRLDNVAGVTIQSSSIRDLFFCEDAPGCQFSIYEPNISPYAGISAVGTSGLTVRDTTIENATYGVFAASRVDTSDWPPVVTSLASGIVMENVDITNSRREAILLVGADDVRMNGISIDNSAMERSMDLIVFQSTSNVTASNMELKGGVNGLMFISALDAPGTSTSNITVSNVSIDSPSLNGIFLNPVTDIAFHNVSITNAANYGVFIYGDEWNIPELPVKDVSFDNFTIADAGYSGLFFMGPSVDLTGNISVTGTPSPCTSYGSLTQNAGSVLLLNGTPLDGSTMADVCS